MARIQTNRLIVLVILAVLTCACSEQSDIPLQSAYPVAVNLSKVGNYPALTKSGAGYVYDDVLEYRVWIHQDGDDYYHAFPTFEEAKRFSDNTERAEAPLVLVLQREHINEPETGKYEHVKGDRITEWQVEWLKRNKRGPGTIANFLREKAKRSAQQ
jgi:putative acetyltransferase